jgi:hypothetical protein
MNLHLICAKVDTFDEIETSKEWKLILFQAGITCEAASAHTMAKGGTTHSHFV